MNGWRQRPWARALIDELTRLLDDSDEAEGHVGRRLPIDVDHRKTINPPSAESERCTRHINSVQQARELLRGQGYRQAGFRAEVFERFGSTMRTPILFLEGEAHRTQRAATARFFAPKTVTTTYRRLMEDASDRLVGDLQATGRGLLDELSLALSVEVAAEIIGLTSSSRAGLARRLDAFFSGAFAQTSSGIGLRLGFLLGQWRLLRFFLADVRPAIAERRKAARSDVISHLVGEGAADREILTECLTYAAAGMATTREFITLAGWHLIGDPALRDRFLSEDEASKISLLEEILRLDPVVGKLYRRGGVGDHLVEIDVRAVNADAAGKCPHALDPERLTGPAMSFGDGPHRCPGAQVALQESAIFLDRLLRVPDLRLATPPTIGWNTVTTGYELRGAMLTCAR
jgi:cytochrome P450